MVAIRKTISSTIDSELKFLFGFKEINNPIFQYNKSVECQKLQTEVKCKVDAILFFKFYSLKIKSSVKKESLNC